MPHLAYVNGRYLPHDHAAVHIEDRGYQFADGVYEVTCIHHGRMIDNDGHMKRLARSLSELRLGWPMSPRALEAVMNELIRKNRIRDGIIYLQITRGVAPRDHAFPADAVPSLVLTTRHLKPFDVRGAKGAKAITIPDIRWKRCDVKSVSLLPNCLGKQQAREAGAYEAIQVDEKGFVTEGTSTNAWIVTAEGELITRDSTSAILNGITRLAILKLARDAGVRFVERSFTEDEARNARELFVSSTTSFVKPIVALNEKPVGDGTIGPVTRRLMDLYAEHMSGPARNAA
jgi:D-alanine transaminase